MHALIRSPFIRKEQQLTFYANETLHGGLCKDGELYTQYLNNPEMVTSTVEAEHEKKQHIDLSAQ